MRKATALALVDLDTASALTGYKARTLAKLVAQDKIAGERRKVERGGRRCARLFVSVESILAYRREMRAPRKRGRTNPPPASEQELVCLQCTVPGGCDEDDPRCLYHNGSDPARPGSPDPGPSLSA